MDFLPILAFIFGTFVGAYVAYIIMKRSMLARKRQMVRDAARQQDQFVSNLAAGLVHELKTPLSTISLNAQLLKEEWRNPVTDREQRAARRIAGIENALNRLNEMLGRFVSFSVSAEVRKQPEDIGKLISETIDDLQSLIVAKKIQIEKQCPSFTANVDRALIRTAIANLLKNAIEASPEGGKVSAVLSNESDDLMISVSDSGTGIPEDVKSKVFHLYYSTKPGGVGLGLPIAKKIVESHGGYITFDSEQGKGSVFRIHLPR